MQEDLKPIADNMGICLYQRFTLNEASLFLRCPEQELRDLTKKCRIEYIQVSKSEIQFFGYQLLQHLLSNVKGSHNTDTKTTPPQQGDTKDRIVRPQEVQKIVGLSRTTLWRMERKGTFPARLPLGAGSVGWRLSDIEEWMKAK